MQPLLLLLLPTLLVASRRTYPYNDGGSGGGQFFIPKIDRNSYLELDDGSGYPEGSQRNLNVDADEEEGSGRTWVPLHHMSTQPTHAVVNFTTAAPTSSMATVSGRYDDSSDSSGDGIKANTHLRSSLAAGTKDVPVASARVTSAPLIPSASAANVVNSQPEDKFIDIDAAAVVKPAVSSAAAAYAAVTRGAVVESSKASSQGRTSAKPLPPQPSNDVEPGEAVKKTLDESQEEETNMIGNAGFAVAKEAHMGERPEGLHPGLLAAVIGGSVVGLLCTILLVMFVVYRLRKKDEGGYSTEDTKPRLHTYTKAPSREFYA